MDVEPAYDVPPYEVLYVWLSSGGHGLNFYPLGEVVDSHDHHATASIAGGKSPARSIAHYMNDCGLIYGWSSLGKSAGTCLKRW
ncbi:hypothetical protein ACFXTN_012136 [Malus domestica]